MYLVAGPRKFVPFVTIPDPTPTSPPLSLQLFLDFPRGSLNFFVSTIRKNPLNIAIVPAKSPFPRMMFCYF